MKPLLRIDDLAVSFAADEGRIEAVRGVSFDIPPCRTVALVGESGSGKTVISQAILGILPKNATIDGGHLFFRDPNRQDAEIDLAAFGQDHPTRRSIRGGRISIIFQEPMSSLSPLHTIGDQIGEAYRLHIEDDRAAAKAAVEDMLDKVGFPDPARGFATYPFELSGGLRQRAMIAMALICRPALLIADEPTTALDVTIQAQILKLLIDLQAELDMAILFITHDLGVVANVADDVVVMYRGRLMERGDRRSLISAPKHPYLKALLRSVPTLHMDPSRRLATLRDDPERELDDHNDSATVGRETRTLLTVSSLQKSFVLRGGTGLRMLRAVDDVSFQVNRGECVSIVGESGSGKTTVAKMVMRALQPDGGSITYHDQNSDIDILKLNERELLPFRRKIQYVFQDPFGSLNPRMTVLDIVSEPLVIHGVDDPAKHIAAVQELLDAVGLDPRHMRRYPHSFSGGQRQRIGIARALALHPELLICDEPVSALDVSVQAQILNLLKDLQRERALTYLFIAHNLAVVRYIAQHVGVMCRGRLVEFADTQSLFDSPQHPYTKALLAAVPEPDLDNPLDFDLLTDERASIPAQWPEPFALGDEVSGKLVDIGGKHLVRMST